MNTIRRNDSDVSGTPTDDPVTCEACGRRIVQATTGRRRRYCNAACRQRAQRRAASRTTPEGSSAVRSAARPGGTQEAGASGSAFAGLPHGGVNPQVSEFRDAPQSWYNAKFASPPDEQAGSARRSVRYKLRQLLRQVTEVERCKRCGREIMGGAAAIVVKDGVAHFAGIETCGRVWLCPVCAAKIRTRRGDEIAEAAGRWIGQGGGVYFATATLPHDQGDALTASLNVLAKCWRALTSGKGYQTDKARFGVVGNIVAKEVTHGANGWHPHIHALMCTQTELDVHRLCEWFHRLDRRWASALGRNGWDTGKQGIRFRLDLVNRSTAANLAAYVTKVQDGGGLGNEIARADLKRGRKASRTPLQILADFGTWGARDDLDLWLEYEKATVGKSAIRWSRGLRAQLLPEVEEQTDEEIAAEEVGGETVAYLLPHTWYKLADIPGAESAILAAVEADGWNGLLRTLLSFRVGTDGLLTPEEWEHTETAA